MIEGPSRRAAGYRYGFRIIDAVDFSAVFFSDQLPRHILAALAFLDVHYLNDSTGVSSIYNGLVGCFLLMSIFSRNVDFGFSRPPNMFGLHLLNACVFSLGVSFNAF